MNSNQKFEIQRLNGYIERIDAIVHEMKSFRKDCSNDTSETIGFAIYHLNNASEELSIGIDVLGE